MFRTGRFALTALVAGTVLAAGLVAGIARADDAKSVIAYRENVMKSMAAHITQIAMVAKGEVSFAAHVVANAQAIANAAKVIPEVFPKGTTEAEAGVESEAKAEIWNEWDKFTAAAKNLETQATKLAEVAAGGDAAAVGAQLGEVGKACGGCHEPFRKKKPE